MTSRNSTNRNLADRDDIDDRVLERVRNVETARSTGLSTEEKAKRERQDAIRDKWENNALPKIDVSKVTSLRGYHLCWLSTTNTHDSISKRMALDYTPVKVSELGQDFEHLDRMASGRFEGCVSCNEMVLFKIPEDVFQTVADLYHHVIPFEHQLNITEQLRSGEGRGARSMLEGGALEIQRQAEAALTKNQRFNNF